MLLLNTSVSVCPARGSLLSRCILLAFFLYPAFTKFDMKHISNITENEHAVLTEHLKNGECTLRKGCWKCPISSGSLEAD